MRNSKYLIVSLLLFAINLNAQDITGLWKGTLFNDTTRQFYRYEIAISEDRGKLSGFSHTWFLDGDKQYFGVKKVKVKKQAGKIIVEDDELIANNYPVAPAKNVRQLNVLTLDVNDTAEILSGPFATNQTKVYSVLTGSINLQRRDDYWQSSLVPHLQELGFAKRLSFINNDIAVAKTVTIDQPLKPGIITIVEPPPAIEAEKEVVLSPVVVTKAAFDAPKVAVKKEPAKTKAPVSVTKKIVPVKEEVVKKETAPAKETPVKKEAIVKKETPVVKKDQPIEKEVVVTTPVKKAQVPISKPAVPLPMAANAALNVKNRSTELQQTVYFKSDSLQLSLFDNGEVDGDTVSVLMNGVIIFAKERLSTNAVRKMVAIDPSQDSVQLIMYAENLGTIAPNTGLLVVKDGRDIYEVRFNGNLQKNAAIVFRRRKP